MPLLNPYFSRHHHRLLKLKPMKTLIGAKELHQLSQHQLSRLSHQHSNLDVLKLLLQHGDPNIANRVSNNSRLSNLYVLKLLQNRGNPDLANKVSNNRLSHLREDLQSLLCNKDNLLINPRRNLRPMMPIVGVDRRSF